MARCRSHQSLLLMLRSLYRSLLLSSGRRYSVHGCIALAEASSQQGNSVSIAGNLIYPASQNTAPVGKDGDKIPHIASSA